MINHYVTLDELDLPHIRVYENGQIYDEETNHWFKPNTPYVYLTNHETKKHYRYARSKLYGYCFRAPWRRRLCWPYRRLDFLDHPSYYATWDGLIFTTWWMSYLTQDISDDGYPECMLVDSKGNPHWYKTHRLIALAFVPNPENKNTVNHIDGNKMNNNASNLEWMWNWENMDHALKTGLKHSVMPDELVHQICKRLSEGSYVNYTQLAREYGIQTHNITDTLDGCHYRIARLYPNIPFNVNARHIPLEFRNERV